MSVQIILICKTWLFNQGDLKMSKQILLIENVIRINDFNQSYIDCVETNIGMVRPLNSRDRPTREDLQDIIKCNVRKFSYYFEGEIHNFKMAWHPDFEKEIGLPLDIIERQSFELEKVTNENVDLQLAINRVNNMNFWQRVKFAFTGRVAK